MPSELLYTSVPSGLDADRHGFCTVQRTRGMPWPLQRSLEALSGLDVTSLPPAMQRIGVFNGTILNPGSELVYVLTRLSPAGEDYSGRSNKLVHHLVLTSDEFPACGPARIAQASGVLKSNWNLAVGELPPPQLRPPGPTPIVLDEWRRVARDPGMAGVVWGHLARQRQFPVWIVVPDSVDRLKLIVELMSLVPAVVQWGTTFSTEFQTLTSGTSCQLRIVSKNSPAFRNAPRAQLQSVVDLTQSTASVPAGLMSFAAVARAGRMLDMGLPDSLSGSAGQVARSRTAEARDGATAASVSPAEGAFGASLLDLARGERRDQLIRGLPSRQDAPTSPVRTSAGWTACTLTGPPSATTWVGESANRGHASPPPGHRTFALAAVLMLVLGLTSAGIALALLSRNHWEQSVSERGKPAGLTSAGRSAAVETNPEKSDRTIAASDPPLSEQPEVITTKTEILPAASPQPDARPKAPPTHRILDLHADIANGGFDDGCIEFDTHGVSRDELYATIIPPARLIVDADVEAKILPGSDDSTARLEVRVRNGKESKPLTTDSYPGRLVLVLVTAPSFTLYVRCFDSGARYDSRVLSAASLVKGTLNVSGDVRDASSPAEERVFRWVPTDSVFAQIQTPIPQPDATWITSNPVADFGAKALNDTSSDENSHVWNIFDAAAKLEVKNRLDRLAESREWNTLLSTVTLNQSGAPDKTRLRNELKAQICALLNSELNSLKSLFKAPAFDANGLGPSSLFGKSPFENEDALPSSDTESFVEEIITNSVASRSTENQGEIQTQRSRHFKAFREFVHDGSERKLNRAAECLYVPLFGKDEPDFDEMPTLLHTYCTKWRAHREYLLSVAVIRQLVLQLEERASSPDDSLFRDWRRLQSVEAHITQLGVQFAGDPGLEAVELDASTTIPNVAWLTFDATLNPKPEDNESGTP
jgi:hypothetical protein